MSKKPTAHRYALTLEYDGTNFSGWQKQKDARTVQGDLFKAAERVFGTKVNDIQGCGRTDAGVHALNYIAHLEAESYLEPEQLIRNFNETLPKDIAVLAVSSTHPRFHARHNCLARSYLYQLKQRKSAFAKRYNWWVREELDLAAMERAAELMVGMHDFRSFAEKKELKKSTKVLVHLVQIDKDEDDIAIRVIGSHFLWHMVRRMVALLVEVGCHRLTEDDVRKLLDPSQKIIFNQTAPAAGLFFERAFYEKNDLKEATRK